MYDKTNTLFKLLTVTSVKMYLSFHMKLVYAVLYGPRLDLVLMFNKNSFLIQNLIQILTNRKMDTAVYTNKLINYNMNV